MHILPVEDSLVMVLSILMVEYVKTTKRLHLRQPPKQPPYHATIRIRCYAHSQRPFQKINNHVSPCCFSSNPLLFLTGTHRQEQTIILARFPLCVLNQTIHIGIRRGWEPLYSLYLQYVWKKIHVVLLASPWHN